MTHYVTDLSDALRALEDIVDDMIAKETESLLNQVSELESEVQELETLVGSLMEFKRLYEEIKGE